jgi:catechol 2,3-dioxygenase-like lactoylglutathione lyase family enzyme
MPRFRMGSLDHVHVMVPDRDAAAAWYAEHLGFEPVAEYDFWATAIEGGPLQISADGGRTMLALFEITDGYPVHKQEAGVAFSVDASTFVQFARSLGSGGLLATSGEPLTADQVVDFDLCWAYNLSDPWGNVYELSCYDYDTVKRDLIDADGIVPVRRWPADITPGTT